MDQQITIENISQALRRISKHPPMVCLRSGNFYPFSVVLEPGISIDQLNQLTIEIPFSLPEDYLEFLKMSNGLHFLEGEGGYFDCLEEAWKTTQLYEFLDGIFCIGCIAEMIFVINCNELDTGKYMYVGDATSHDEFISLNTDFTGFLGTFLECNATLYWDWVNYEEIKRYDFGQPY